MLGLPVRYETNWPPVLDAVRATLGDSGTRDPSRPNVAPVARIRLIRHGSQEPDHGAPNLLFRLPSPNRLLVFTPGSFGVAEADRLEAYAYVTEQLVNDPQVFNPGFVEALSLMLLTRDDRFPIHAATIARRGTAVLLAGASGSGKSTLAYTASQAGLDVLGDDVAFIQLHPCRRAWTMPSRYSLMPHVAKSFHELSSAVPSQLPTGKTKVVVRDRTWTSSNMVESFGVCLLENGSGAASLVTIGVDELEAELDAMNDTGFDIFSDERRASVLRALSQHGGWRLGLSRDPRDSLPLIHEILSSLERGADSTHS